MKVLVIALDAQIRDALEAQFEVRNRAFTSVGEQWLSANDSVGDNAPVLVIPKDIDIVVNALTLESLERRADMASIDPLSLLSQVCEQQSIPLIQLSNSQVYDGFDGGRHRETDAVVPASKTGALLARMEEVVRANCKQHIILRTGPLFSSSGNNLLTALLAKFKRGELLRLSSSGKSCPMHTKDMARVVSAIIDQLSCGCESWGTYHYCSPDPVSSYQFAETVLAVVSQYMNGDEVSLTLEPVDTADTDWPRPLFNCEKILNTFGIKQLPWRAFVVPTVEKIFKSEKNEEASDE